MTIKTGALLIGMACLLVVLALRFVPIFTKSSQDDISGGDSRVIKIKRPYYVLPREFHSQGGMNPINFWSHAPDPNFNAGKIYSHDYLDINGKISRADIQGFHVNRTFDNPNYREEIMAIRNSNAVHEFAVPGFGFVAYSGKAGFRFIGQDGDDLYYYFWNANRKVNLGISAIVRINLPFESGRINIITSSDGIDWEREIDKVRSITHATEAFSELCADRFHNSVEFAEFVFNSSCPAQE